MRQVTDYTKDAIPTLLASDVVDASGGALFSNQGKLKPNDRHRTILIGIGGTGVQTIDHVKGVIKQRLDDTWSKYIAFLGIDTNDNELSQAAHLLPRVETVATTLPGVDDRMRDPSAYPVAWRRFVKPSVISGIQGANLPGASRKRLVGKLKIHDKNSERAVDMSIVEKLAAIKANVLAPLTDPNSHYEVYVIGSVCGGTCSGSFLEMPALIHKALNCPAVTNVYAMLYLPDTLAQLDAANASELKANGYAALKELNYYQGVTMRANELPNEELFSYNDRASLTLRCTKMFDLPYLIGTPSGSAANSVQIARQNIAEFLISLLGNVNMTGADKFLTDDFLSNALGRVDDKPSADGAEDKEANGYFHEMPRHYGAIGYAQAAAPRNIARSYVVSNACAQAGIKPISAADRSLMQSANMPGAAQLPWRDETDLLNADVGTATAREVVKPLVNLLNNIHAAQFSIIKTLPNWGSGNQYNLIQAGDYNAGSNAGRIQQVMSDATSTRMMDQVSKQIKAAYAAYLTSVKEYVKKEGPLAFVSLYRGNFVQVDGVSGTGIQAMLRNIKEGKFPEGAPMNWTTPAAAQNDLNGAQAAIGKARLWERGKTASTWIGCFDKVQQAQIVEARRNYAFGDNKEFFKSFLIPANLLADRLEALGHVLSALSDIYTKHGRYLDDYSDFAKATDSPSEINLCAVSSKSHRWLKQQADEALKTINGNDLRDDLVESIFTKMDQWVDVPEGMVTITGSTVKMAHEGTAIPARKLFDEVLKKHVPDTLALSVKDAFTAAAEGNSITQFADQVVSDLAAASKPMFNGVLDQRDYRQYIMYPSALNGTTEGSDIATALKTAAQSRFPGIQVYSSDDTDTVRMYQLVAPFEIYRMNDLKDWEDNYFAHYNEYLHGMSPDVEVKEVIGDYNTYREITSWRDYPNICPSARDLKLPDSQTGRISEEGRLRKKLDEMIQLAREMGVLYSQEENGKWRIYRVYCDKSIPHWKLNPMVMVPDANTGLLPSGKALAEAVADQNDKTLAEISQAVELVQGGIFSQPHITEENAWKYCEDVLRAHHPMQIKVRKTVELFKPWYAQIKERNADQKERWKPAYLPYLINSGMLEKDERNYWYMELPNGTKKPVANFGMELSQLYIFEPTTARLMENGYSAYVLYQNLMALPEMQGDGLENAYIRAKALVKDMLSHNRTNQLDDYRKASQFLFDELKRIDEQGAELDRGDGLMNWRDLSQDFRAAMGKLLIGADQVDEAIKLRNFYVRLRNWDKLR